MREIPIVILGLGNVGSALLHQILDTRAVLAQRAGLRLVPIGLADVSGILFDPDGLPEETLRAALETTVGGGLLAKDTHGTVIRLAPPLVITKEELDWALERIEDVLSTA